MKNKHIASKIYISLVMLFLYLPIFVLIIFRSTRAKLLFGKVFRSNGMKNFSEMIKL